MSRFPPSSIRFAHPEVPNPIPWVMDLVRQRTRVELPYQIEGTMKSVELKFWYFEADVNTEPYFQIKFSDGLVLRNLTFGGRGDNNEVVGFPMESAIQVPIRGRSMSIPLIHNSMFSRVFTVELFDSGGAPITPRRCVLWFHIILE